MVTLGRDVYHNFAIRGDFGPGIENFIRSIRFSTHGEFFCMGSGLNLKIHNHPHFHEYNHEVCFYKTITFSDNSFCIANTSHPSVSSEDGLSSLVDMKSVMKKKIRFLDFIVNADGSIEYVCSLNFLGIPIHDPSFKRNVLVSYLASQIKTEPGDTLTIVLDQPIKSLFLIYKNYVFRHWVTYRAVGINVPLLIIQILLGRNVITLPLVDVENVIFDSDRPVYRMKKNSMFWFDLDETLICRSRPIWQTIRLLFRLREKGQKLGLITRHTFDLNETLKKIAVDPSIFDSVLTLTKGVKKSAYVGQEDIFIDNEFPERSDVRRNSVAMVLDIDQIDFIDSVYG